MHTLSTFRRITALVVPFDAGSVRPPGRMVAIPQVQYGNENSLIQIGKKNFSRVRRISYGNCPILRLETIRLYFEASVVYYPKVCSRLFASWLNILARMILGPVYKPEASRNL